MSSPLKGPAIFSDAFGSSSSSSGHRKRTYQTHFQHPNSNSSSRKRFRTSPTAGRSFSTGHTAWKDQHQLAQSSPIKPRKSAHFTTSGGPNVSFFRGTSNIAQAQSQNFAAVSDDEDDLLPMHSFKMPSMEIRSSPPRTPPPIRGRASMGGRRSASAATKTNGHNGKPTEEGADLLLYLATSPSPANNPARNRQVHNHMNPPSTPPPRNLALPSSMMTTPGGGGGLLGGIGPYTPGQNFDFADFVNITPSPAQNAWSRTPGGRTPATVARKRLTFEGFPPSPVQGLDRNGNGNGVVKHAGLGMQLGGPIS